MAEFGVFPPPQAAARLSDQENVTVDSSGGERMRSINQAIVMGNVGRDPDIRFTQSGRKVAAFSIATTERWKDKVSGERAERTEWHRIVILNDALVSVVEKFVRKGATVHVTGRLQTRHWIDQNKHDRYTTEIVLLPYAGDLILLDRKEPEQASDLGSDIEAETVPAAPSDRPDLDEVPL